MILGAHMSIAGGMHHALEAAHGFQFNTLAVFVRNQRQWRVPPLPEGDVELFRETRRRLGISPIVAHGSYLLNLSGTPEIRGKSIEAIVADLDRCERLGIEFLVIHPGSHSDAAEGLRLIAQGLDEIQAARSAGQTGTKILLEGTAGSGHVLCSTFEQLAEILSLVKEPLNLGVCLDTCHIFAAGYDIRTPETYRQTMEQFDHAVGLPRLMTIHLNDSLREFGSHVDRHMHIGLGKIGPEGIANFVNDKRLANIPMILETPKGIRESDGLDWDEVNGRAVRSLLR